MRNLPTWLRIAALRYASTGFMVLLGPLLSKALELVMRQQCLLEASPAGALQISVSSMVEGGHRVYHGENFASSCLCSVPVEWEQVGGGCLKAMLLGV